MLTMSILLEPRLSMCILVCEDILCRGRYSQCKRGRKNNKCPADVSQCQINTPLPLSYYTGSYKAATCRK